MHTTSLVSCLLLAAAATAQEIQRCTDTACSSCTPVVFTDNLPEQCQKLAAPSATPQLFVSELPECNDDKKTMTLATKSTWTMGNCGNNQLVKIKSDITITGCNSALGTKLACGTDNVATVNFCAPNTDCKEGCSADIIVNEANIKGCTHIGQDLWISPATAKTLLCKDNSITLTPDTAWITGTCSAAAPEVKPISEAITLEDGCNAAHGLKLTCDTDTTDACSTLPLLSAAATVAAIFAAIIM